MLKQLFIILIIFSNGAIFAQDLELITPVATAVNESSGLIYLNEKLITHNDSGNDAQLFEIDSLTGNVTRTVVINNATITDWEDIAYDDDYIFIGDFGNNNGSRTDLKVYRILQSDYFETDNNEAEAEIISFQYGDQSDFSPNPFTTNYDAEAFISYQDSLYIFTKNWGDNRTNIYSLSKHPGDYTISRCDSMDAQGMITGADFNQMTGRIILSGYTLVSPFAFIISAFPPEQFSQGQINYYDLHAPSGYSYQIEGVSQINPTTYYFTSEGSFLGDAGLFKLNLITTGTTKREKEAFSISPNPASDYFAVRTNEKITIKLYNSHGELVKVEASNKVNARNLARGTYLVEIRGSENEILATKRIVLN